MPRIGYKYAVIKITKHLKQIHIFTGITVGIMKRNRLVDFPAAREGAPIGITALRLIDMCVWGQTQPNVNSASNGGDSNSYERMTMSEEQRKGVSTYPTQIAGS